jgi:hypothetical protein
MTTVGPVINPARVTELLAALDVYRPARQQLLATLGLGSSNRDPLAEFSEHLVGALMGGTLATGRVQAQYDLITSAGQKVQVRYLANPSGAWVNEHVVYRMPGVEWYALVLFEAFAVTTVLAFRKRSRRSVLSSESDTPVRTRRCSSPDAIIGRCVTTRIASVGSGCRSGCRRSGKRHHDQPEHERP